MRGTRSCRKPIAIELLCDREVRGRERRFARLCKACREGAHRRLIRVEVRCALALHGFAVLVVERGVSVRACVVAVMFAVSFAAISRSPLRHTFLTHAYAAVLAVSTFASSAASRMSCLRRSSISCSSIQVFVGVVAHDVVGGPGLELGHIRGLISLPVGGHDNCVLTVALPTSSGIVANASVYGPSISRPLASPLCDHHTRRAFAVPSPSSQVRRAGEGSPYPHALPGRAAR